MAKINVCLIGCQIFASKSRSLSFVDGVSNDDECSNFLRFFSIFWSLIGETVPTSYKILATTVRHVCTNQFKILYDFWTTFKI